MGTSHLPSPSKADSLDPLASGPQKDAEWGHHWSVMCSTQIAKWPPTGQPKLPAHEHVLYGPHSPLEIYHLLSLPTIKIIGTMCLISKFPTSLRQSEDLAALYPFFQHGSPFSEVGGSCPFSQDQRAQSHPSTWHITHIWASLAPRGILRLPPSHS